MKIKIGQIGTGHAHASGKMATYRQSPDFEVVGVVENDPALKERAQAAAVYRDLPFLTTEELLNTPGLQAVAVETKVRDLLASDEKCLVAGKHIHIDKPAGESLAALQRLLSLAA